MHSSEERRRGARPTRGQIKQRQQQQFVNTDNADVPETLSFPEGQHQDTLTTAAFEPQDIAATLPPPARVEDDVTLPFQEDIPLYDEASKFAEQLSGTWNARVLQEAAEAKAAEETEQNSKRKGMTREEAEAILKRTEDMLTMLRQELRAVVDAQPEHASEKSKTS
jgi:hypothetical protein